MSTRGEVSRRGMIAVTMYPWRGQLRESGGGAEQKESNYPPHDEKQARALARLQMTRHEPWGG
ncbi:MAG: hypothetical protein ABIJ23_00665 [Candidatus Magasanikbacteria bacterium]